MKYNEIIEQARKTWNGKLGDERAERVKKILDTRLDDYSKVTGFSKDEILEALERKRRVNTVNFYQEHQLPLLDNVFVFNTIEDFTKAYPSGLSTCPNCNREATNFYECSKCGWKIYGLLKDLGKGIKIIIRDKFLKHPIPENIFMPIEHEKLKSVGKKEKDLKD